MNKSKFHLALQSAAICGITTLLFGGLVTSAAAADPFNKTVSTKVSYADLNLASPAGAKELYRRINKAARQVCGDSAIPKGVSGMVSIRECERTAVANAVKDVNNNHLTALHMSQGKQQRLG